jgi:dTDP-4-amino-4,6-dideoxygalactose transaminase
MSNDLSVIPIIRPWLGDEEAEAASAAIRSGWIAQGPNVAALEADFAELVGARNAVAVSNCTTALHLALIGAGIGPGDEVVVPSFSFIATTNAVLYVGATPVFCDIDELSGNATVDTIRAVLTPLTKAVIVVDQGGVPADIDAIRALCDEHGITIVEDAACAIGSTYKGALVGNRAPYVAFSFHPRKLVTCGEGGMLTVEDDEVAARLRKLREHGMSVSAADRHASGGLVFEQYDETGFNYRMTDVQAAIARVQLGKLDRIIERRRELADRYHVAIEPLDGLRAVRDPACGTTNYQSFWVVVGPTYGLDRNGLMASFMEAGISTRRGIMAAHLEEACCRFATDPLPNTEHLTANSLILPLYHDMTVAEQDRVIAVLEHHAQ